MPRSPTGDYTLPLPPVITGQTIEASWANQTLADMQQALTDSLSRSNQGNMQQHFLAIDGNISAPGISFVNEAGTGFYRPTAGDLYLAVLGVDFMRWTDDNGVQIWDGATWYEVTDENQLAVAVAALQSQITTNATDIGNLETAGTALDGRVTDLEDNVTPNPIVSPNFRSAGSIRHLLNITTSINVGLYNRSYEANNGALSLNFTGLPTVADPNLGANYQVEGQVVVKNGATPGAVAINGITPTVVIGNPSLVANAGCVLTYLIQYRSGTVTSFLIWSTA